MSSLLKATFSKPIPALSSTTSSSSKHLKGQLGPPVRHVFGPKEVSWGPPWGKLLNERGSLTQLGPPAFGPKEVSWGLYLHSQRIWWPSPSLVMMPKSRNIVLLRLFLQTCVQTSQLVDHSLHFLLFYKLFKITITLEPCIPKKLDWVPNILQLLVYMNSKWN